MAEFVFGLGMFLWILAALAVIADAWDAARRDARRRNQARPKGWQR